MIYHSPLLGDILLFADEHGLTGLYLAGQAPAPPHGSTLSAPSSLAHNTLLQTARWLDVYLSGKEPDFTPPLYPSGTAFQEQVWQLLCAIPYGQTTSYGEIAKQIAAKRGIPKMSAQAVGFAVGHNPISILIPCHRVIGANGALTGYAGGLEKKAALLRLEGILQ